MKQGARRFFKYARERHQVYLNREAGLSRDKWTRDPILQQYRFTNVFRELDKTTTWFRQNVRDRLRDIPDVLLATVVFRMLNRIEVGEAIFCQQLLPLGRFKKAPGPTAWDAFRGTGDTSILRHASKTALPRGPYVTGAYIISSAPGKPKLDGVLEVIGRFYKQKKRTELSSQDNLLAGWREVANNLLGEKSLRMIDFGTLEDTFLWLSQYDYFGKFHSYEIVTDLRHTALLDRAPDINTWCNVGPGARRGLNRVMGRDYKDKTTKTPQMLAEMQELLALSRDPSQWPMDGRNFGEHWPAWELRDVEHTLCEFDKYERVRLGQGTPRGVYR